MAKKRNPKSIDSLAAQADTHLQAGRYRDAIAVYKQLLKRESRAEWREALADAYLGRAEQLAAKAMYQEAAALWENMAGLCGTRHLDRYVDWLLHGGRVTQAARYFTEADATFQASAAGQRLAARLAGLLVCGHDEIAEALPADSPLVQQRRLAQDAMQAYCRGDDQAMKASLKAIPFRSPYKELRLILQGLAALDTDPGAARALLDRIDADSPFARFADLTRIATLEDTALLDAVTRLPQAERGFVLTLRGWSPERIELAGRLPNPRQTTPKALLRFALSADQAIDPARLERFALAVLPHYPAGLAEVEKRFAPQTRLERERIHALAAELREEPAEARAHWRNCVNALMPPRIDTDDALEAALILRRLADLNRALEGPDPWNENVRDCLALSLDLDPDDKPSYLRLMELARQRDDRKDQDYWTERAVKRFPEDAEVLMAAGLAAYRRHSFKKAARFARTLLERDSINPHARNLLISCHLAHARKQVRAGRYDLVEPELDAAESFARDAEQRGIVTLNRGLVALTRNATHDSEPLLARGLQQLGDGLIARFRYLVDGLRLGISLRNLTRQVNQLQNRMPNPERRDIVRLAELLHRYLDDGVKELPTVLDRLQAPIKAATTLEFTEQELQAVCAALRRAGHHDLLKDYAATAMERFGRKPRFLFYHLFGRTKGREERLSMMEQDQLHFALNQALDEQDTATADMIEEFLGLPAFGPGGFPPLPPEFAQGLGDFIEQIMDQLGTDDPEEALDFIEQQVREEGELPPLPIPLPKGKR